jgi:hypothetical protein
MHILLKELEEEKLEKQFQIENRLKLEEETERLQISREKDLRTMKELSLEKEKLVLELDQILKQNSNLLDLLEQTQQMHAHQSQLNIKKYKHKLKEISSDKKQYPISSLESIESADIKPLSQFSSLERDTPEQIIDNAQTHPTYHSPHTHAYPHTHAHGHTHGHGHGHGHGQAHASPHSNTRAQRSQRMQTNSPLADQYSTRVDTSSNILIHSSDNNPLALVGNAEEGREELNRSRRINTIQNQIDVIDKQISPLKATEIPQFKIYTPSHAVSRNTKLSNAASTHKTNSEHKYSRYGY